MRFSEKIASSTVKRVKVLLTTGRLVLISHEFKCLCFSGCIQSTTTLLLDGMQIQGYISKIWMVPLTASTTIDISSVVVRQLACAVNRYIFAYHRMNKLN